MNEIDDYCLKKIRHLVEFIHSSDNNIGECGVYIKNGLFSTHYERLVKWSPDTRNFFWNDFLKRNANSHGLLLYRIKPGGKLIFIVTSKGHARFKELFPDAESV